MTTQEAFERDQQAHDFAELKRILLDHGLLDVEQMVADAWEEIVDEAADEPFTQEEENRLNDPRRGLAEELNREIK